MSLLERPCWLIAAITLGVLLIAAPGAWAKPHELRIPLHDGKLSIDELSEALASELHVPERIIQRVPIKRSIDVRKFTGMLAVQALNSALGDAFHLTVSDDALIVDVDPDKLPKSWDETADAVARAAGTASPRARAMQRRRWGLLLPERVDSSRPLAVLVHGLDGDASCCVDLKRLIEKSGGQAAIFSYPAEQPIERSAQLLARHLQAVRGAFPGIKFDLITESMGGLVAREYLEGPLYRGGVVRLIEIAPPNHGSSWAHYSPLVKVVVDGARWATEPDWQPAWFFSEGLCQSGREMVPGSPFMRALNSRGRRAGVAYTIIAGDRLPGYRYLATTLGDAAKLIKNPVARIYAMGQLGAELDRAAGALMRRQGQADGPVTVASAQLRGVSDFNVVPADHQALYEQVGGQPPAAWPIIRDRLELTASPTR